MGQLGMTGELSPVRHPAKRRRLRTVLQELVHRAALVIHKWRGRSFSTLARTSGA